MMNKGWKMVKLGDISIIQAGGTPSRGNVNYWKNGKIPWIKIGDIKRKYTFSATEFITKDGLDNSSAKFFKPNTILYTIFATIGETSILKFEATTNQAIAGIEIINTNEVNIGFIYYYLRSIKQNVISISRGIAQNNINLGILRNFDIPLPPLKEQLQIATTLDKASELISLRKKQLEEMDALAESVFYDMFGDPVKNEKGWKKKIIKDIAKVRIGPFGSLLHAEDYVCNGIPLINPSHMSNGEINADINFTITAEKIKELEVYRLRHNDIVMGRRGDIGRCAFVSNEADGYLCGTGSLFIRFEQKVIPLYVLKVLSSQTMKNLLISKAKGATMLNINCKIVEQISVPIPPLPLQTQFATIIEKIESQKVLAKKALQESEDLFQRLMQDLFNLD